jgi:hypothetical protein
MNESKEAHRLRELEETVAREQGISIDTFRRLLAKVEAYSESHRAFGLQDELLIILQEDLRRAQDPETTKHAGVPPM